MEIVPQDHLFIKTKLAVINGGAERGRTADLLNAIQALSQLSYSPTGANGEAHVEDFQLIRTSR